MKKTLKAFFFILLLLSLCFSLCACYATDEMNQRNGTLLTERFPELMDFETTSADGSKPGSLENYIVIHLNGEEWQFLAKNINGDTSLDQELTESDMDALDVIALAHSVFNKADYAIKGSDTVYKTIASETVYVKYFNTKENCFFANDKIPGEKLPDETSSKTGDSKILPDKVLLKTDERLPLKLGLFGRVKMWLFGNLGYWALLIIVAAGAGLTVLFVKVADMIRVKISDKSEEARKKRNNKA